MPRAKARPQPPPLMGPRAKPQPATGTAGDRGATGAAGAPGAIGAAGWPGAPGAEGPEGEEGPPGPPGATGAAGAIGPAGVMGPSGPPGADGAEGDEGPPGAVGAPGPRGWPGAIGPPGADGADGEDGLPGPPGRDASKTTSTFTITTTGNVDDLDFQNADVIRLNNATLTTLRGLKAGIYDGQQVTLVSIGAGQVNLSHQDTGSTAACRLINTVSSIKTPLAAGTGYATYAYDLTTARWRLVLHEQGAVIDIPYTSTDYTATGGMTWTVDAGDVTTFAYRLQGATMIYFVNIITCSIVAPLSSTLLVALYPVGVTVTKTCASGAQISDNGTAVPGSMQMILPGSQLSFRRSDKGNFAASTNASSVLGMLQVAIS